jgi:hypothetical protein
MNRVLACAMIAMIATPVHADRPKGSGVYAIWYGKDASLFDLPFVRGGQAIAQWREVEPSPGEFDFTALDRQLKPLHERGLKATVQINGNRKPDDLFDRVPYYPEHLSHQVNDPKGTLMFWHPAHMAAYQGLIQALGEYLRHSPYRGAVLGVRLNFNAFGTEHSHLPPGKAREARNWITPTGAAPGSDWSSSVVRDYQGMVFRAYLQHISPNAYVFVRNGLPEDIAKDYREDFAAGRLGWFHTSSEAEPRAGSEWRYQRFYTDCRSGRTTAYAEPWASAWGHHGGKTDDRACSPPQWNYWRLLLDLHNGVSFIAAYSADLKVAQTGTYRYGKAGLIHDDAKDHTNYRQEFADAFAFANRYAGYHASPKTSPGAWCAFRGNEVIREANGRPEKARQLKFYTGDYNFLMERLPDGSEALGTTGPDDQRFGGWARRLKAGGKLTVRLDSAFAASVEGTSAFLHVVYLDDGSGGGVECAGRKLSLSGSGTKRWQTASFPVDSWRGTDITIRAGARPLALHMVELCRPAQH